jgi:hypothetical protein
MKQKKLSFSTMNSMKLQRMIIPRTIKKANRLIIGAALSFAFASAGFCQESEEQDDTESSAAPIEEIVVHGEKTRLALRNEVYVAENKLFDMFNELNDDDQYDINCKFEATIGSNIRRRVCRANYLSALKAEARSRSFSDAELNPKVSDTRIEEKRKILAEKMAAYLAENPEFLKRSVEYAGAQKEYDAASE